MASVQDGGVVGDTKKTLGLGTADPPLILEVPSLLLITREAQPPSVWDSRVWRFGVGAQSIGPTVAERQSIALINPGTSGTAFVSKEVIIRNSTGAQFEIREGPIGLFLSPASTDWSDFGRAGDPAATIDTLSQVGVVAGSQVRELGACTVEEEIYRSHVPYVIHPLQALIVNGGTDNIGFQVTFSFEQFRSSSQF